MNKELIKQLRKEAITKWAANHGITVHKFLNEQEPEDIESLEVFAELIVEECLDILEDEKYNRTLLTCNPTESGAIYDAKYNIKSHFGIKK